jgi:pyruvate,water dikinase
VAPISEYDSFQSALPYIAPDGDNISGIGACPGVVRGRVRVVLNPREASLNEGEILVAQQTDPGWVVLFPAASGLLVERGSLLSHSAIVARELNLPCVVSIPDVTKILKTGDFVEMDGKSGTVTIIKDED